MQALCKTNKGTIHATTFGNTWCDYEQKEKGIRFGLLNNPSLGMIVYDEDNDKMVISIHKARAKELGIEVIMR